MRRIYTWLQAFWERYLDGWLAFWGISIPDDEEE